MRTCIKCKGAGRLQIAAGLKNDVPCWLCECTGQLPPPDMLAIVGDVLSQRTGLPLRQLFAPQKQALGLIGKRGPWGKIPLTLEEAEGLWKATIYGRRCTYVHMLLQHAIDPRVKLRHLIAESCAQDAYLPELKSIAQTILDEKLKGTIA